MAETRQGSKADPQDEKRAARGGSESQTGRRQTEMAGATRHPDNLDAPIHSLESLMPS